MQNVKLPTEQTTVRFAQAVAQVLSAGDCLWLTGPLGVGKTTFVRALTRALGSRDAVSSPSYVLMQSYAIGQGAIRSVHHVDAYRLAEPDALLLAELDDLACRGDGLIIIEWAEHLRGRGPKPTLELQFHYGEGTSRHVTITGVKRLVDVIVRQR